MTEAGGVVAGLRGRISDVLEETIPAGSPVALLDFPTHANVGDYAIWLGELSYLRRSGRQIAYACTMWDYSKERLAAGLDGGTILLHGGGNLGDLWPSHQDFRERVLADFPDRKVVQLPQSVHFQSPRRLEQARRAFASHRDFTLLVRDVAGHEVADRAFECASALCPDSAFELGSLPHRSTMEADVVCLLRTDAESALGEGRTALAAQDLTDWLDDPSRHHAAARRMVLAAGQLARRSALAAPLVSGLLQRSYATMAARQLRIGVELLGRGSVVVTDRLHGHILCLLLGLPHVLLDNSYGKLRSFHETWTAASPLTRWADGPDDAVEEARLWAAELRQGA